MQTIYYDLRDTKGQQKEIEDKISAAAKILREGGLVGIPTETVYGLGADGTNPAAVQRIFEVKGRPQDNPLILHVIARLVLGKICVVSNHGSHRAHALHTGGKVFLVKGSAVFLQAGVSKSDVGRV